MFLFTKTDSDFSLSSFSTIFIFFYGTGGGFQRSVYQAQRRYGFFGFIELLRGVTAWVTYRWKQLYFPIFFFLHDEPLKMGVAVDGLHLCVSTSQ